MSYSYWSRIGFPMQILSARAKAPDPIFDTILARDPRGFYRQGDVLGGFTFPENAMIHTRGELFERYNLYENRAGINTPGEPFVAIARVWVKDHVWNLTTEKPVFVGDFLAEMLSSDPSPLTVSWVLAYYDEETKLYHSTVLLADLPSPVTQTPKNLWTENLVVMVDEIRDAVEVFVGSCQSTGEGNPLFIEDAKALWESRMKQIKEKLQESRL